MFALVGQKFRSKGQRKKLWYVVFLPFPSHIWVYLPELLFIVSQATKWKCKREREREIVTYFQMFSSYSVAFSVIKTKPTISLQTYLLFRIDKQSQT